MRISFSLRSGLYCCILFLSFFVLSQQSFAAVDVDFVPPNDPTGALFSTNANDGWDEGRGLVFEVTSDVTIESIGLFQDLTGIDLSFTIAQVTQTTGQVTTGQTILASGNQIFTNTGLEWNEVSFAPITLTTGNFYHLEFSFVGNSNQNFFYNNANVPWTQGDFTLLEGTQNGNAGNSVVAAFRLVCPDDAAGVPTLGQWGLICLSLIFFIFGVVAIRNRSLQVA